MWKKCVAGSEGTVSPEGRAGQQLAANSGSNWNPGACEAWCQEWVAIRGCCREEATGKSQTYPEDLGQGKKNQLAAVSSAAAKPVLNSLLVIFFYTKFDSRRCIYLIIFINNNLGARY